MSSRKRKRKHQNNTKTNTVNKQINKTLIIDASSFIDSIDVQLQYKNLGFQ